MHDTKDFVSCPMIPPTATPLNINFPDEPNYLLTLRKKWLKTALMIKKPLLLITTALSITFLGCEKEGPAEKVGESIDNAADSVKDAVTKDGPVENAGEAVDEAVGN